MVLEYAKYSVEKRIIRVFGTSLWMNNKNQLGSKENCMDK